MGYHNLSEIAFLTVAVRQTNCAEDAVQFEKWIFDGIEKAKCPTANDKTFQLIANGHTHYNTEEGDLNNGKVR